MKKSKGQALIEFALVFPFFLFLILGVIYSGMLFYDYSTLSNVARAAARERAITSKTDKSNDDIIGYYVNNSGKFRYGQITSLYTPASPPMSIETKDENNTLDENDILVTIRMTIDNRSPWMEIILPPSYSIVYHMRKDYK